MRSYQINVKILREAPSQAAVSFAMMLVSGDRNSPGGLCGDQMQLYLHEGLHLQSL
jgi:hypothetical protein